MLFACWSMSIFQCPLHDSFMNGLSIVLDFYGGIDTILHRTAETNDPNDPSLSPLDPP